MFFLSLLISSFVRLKYLINFLSLEHKQAKKKKVVPHVIYKCYYYIIINKIYYIILYYISKKKAVQGIYICVRGKIHVNTYTSKKELKNNY